MVLESAVKKTAGESQAGGNPFYFVRPELAIAEATPLLPSSWPHLSLVFRGQSAIAEHFDSVSASAPNVLKSRFRVSFEVALFDSRGAATAHSPGFQPREKRCNKVNEPRRATP